MKTSWVSRPGQWTPWGAGAAAAIVVACGPWPALAQEVRLPGLVVEGATLARPPARPAPRTTAAPTSQPSAQPAEAAEVDREGDGEPGVPAAEVGSSVTVVTGRELRDRQVRTAADALQSLPGVHVSRNSTAASVTEVRIRGAENNHTLVLIDGVPANDPTSGAYDFSDLSVVDIERIEVIRGAQSVIYGSGAVGGVINIITR